LIFGALWSLLVFFTIFVTTFGDCADPPGTSSCEDRRASLQHRLLLAEFALLAGVGWLFYRREMKDGEF
jgi:hypothetical protein